MEFHTQCWKGACAHIQGDYLFGVLPAFGSICLSEGWWPDEVSSPSTRRHISHHSWWCEHERYRYSSSNAAGRATGSPFHSICLLKNGQCKFICGRALWNSSALNVVLWGTFLDQLHDHIPGMDINRDQCSHRGPSLFGQFPSHQLHDILQLILELLVVILQSLHGSQSLLLSHLHCDTIKVPR